MAVVRSSSTSYAVFLNFRGEDTRETFTRKLYMALVRGGLPTFRDEDMMEKGENLKSELEKAIRQSKSSIVVISKDYASSTWCLDELVLILKQRRTSGHVVLPVFYDVDPSHVRKQSGRIAEVFARYEEQFEAETDSERKRKLMEKIKGWRSALTEVGYLNGPELRNHVDGHESKFIKKIVKIIGDKLIQKVVLKTIIAFDPVKIKRIISKIDGVKNVTVDPRKELITVTGRMDVKELVLHVQDKIHFRAEVISPAKKDDEGGENKEKGGEKGGDKNEKDSGGDKKEKESGGGGGEKKEKGGEKGGEKNEKDSGGDEKEKESGGGGGGKRENKYNLHTNKMLMYHQRDKEEKERGGRVSKKENKMEYYGYNPNTYMLPGYHQGYSVHYYTGPLYHYSQDYSGHGYTVECQSEPSYHSPTLFSDDNPNACSIM